MNTQEKQDLLLVADYTNHEKTALSKGMRRLFLLALLAMGIYFVVADMEQYDAVAGFMLGAVTGVLILGVLYTSKYMMKIREYKLGLFKKIKNKF